MVPLLRTFLLFSCARFGHGLAVRAITGPWPAAFPAKDLCSNCGLCKSEIGVVSVAEACAFLGDGMGRAESLEPLVHGRGRQYNQSDLDEAHFGVHEEILLARGFQVNAQWTGVCTGVALAWLESGKVDAVVVTAGKEASGFGAPQPLICRTAEEVLQGRRVKPSLSPSLEVLDDVKSDGSIKRLLYCGVGCSVQALRAMNGGDPEGALGLDELYVLGTHCVDNSPTPEASRTFVSKLPGVGVERADDVLAYEFMADFRVHTRLRESAVVGPDSASVPVEESTVKPAYMTLPPSIGIPSIAPSCFSCFDYTNGLADLVVGYMGAPFTGADAMQTAPLMVTVRNAKGRAMLDAAVECGKVEVLQRGGKGGGLLPSSGSRGPITMKTVEGDSMVKSLTNPSYVAGGAGAPPWVADILATLIAKGLPKGIEFARYSIDYHYLRNALYVDAKMSPSRSDRHVPEYAKAIMTRYADDMARLKKPPESPVTTIQRALARAFGAEGGS